MKKPVTLSVKHPENTISKIFLGAITLFACVAIAIRPLVPGMASGADANMFIEAFVFVAVCLWILRMAWDRRLTIVNTGLEIPLLAFLILAIVSVGISSYKLPSLKVALDWTSFILLFLLVANLCVDNHWRNLFLQVLFASAFIVAVNGIYQYFFAFTDIESLIEGDPMDVIRRLRLPITPEQWPDFKARVMTKEVYSTFIIPNSLSGFLIILLPVLVGHLIDLLRSRLTRLSIMSLVAGGCGLAAMLVCLYLTKAKGGLAAGACGFMVFIALACRRMPSRYRKILVVAVLIAVIVGGSLAMTGVMPLPSRNEIYSSVEVRAGYWRGTCAAIKDHLWLGVGLDNFGDYYAMYKKPFEGETQKAHNNYLQVWLEMGIFGLIAFVMIWVAFLRRMLRSLGNAQQTGSLTLQGEQGIYLMGIGAWFFAFWLLITLAQWVFTGLTWTIALIFAPVWLAYYLLSVEVGLMERRPLDMQFSMMGILAGVVAFLLHSIIDFDLYVHGIFQSVMVLLAIALPFRGLKKKQYIINRELNVSGQIICSGVAVVILAIPMFFVFRSGSAAFHMWEGERGVITASETKVEEVFLRRAAEAIEDFKKAFEANPFDDKACMAIAQMSQQLYRNTKQRTFLSQAIEYNRKAVELRPNSASHHFQLANLYVLGLQYDLADIQSVIAEFKAAVEHYPAKPAYSAYLGMAYARAERTVDARREFLRALQLDKEARIDRLRLEATLRGKIHTWLEQNPPKQME